MVDVERELLKDTLVLFSGTGCQIAALLKFLQRRNVVSSKLLTVEIVCHGVPSYLSFHRYLVELSKGKKIDSINFCDKSVGWRNRSVKVDFSDGSTYRKLQRDDYYMKMFVKNISLRPSCYECSFKNFTSGSDIVLGAFWGYDEFVSEDNKENGCSLVILNTEKGHNVFSKIGNAVFFRKSNINVAMKGNPCLSTPVKKNKYRSLYFKLLSKNISYSLVVIITKFAELLRL